MPMMTHELIQGTPEWIAHRQNYDNASDAAAMLGVSPLKTRRELLREYATGIAAEVTPFQQALYDEGHRAERLARPLAEKIIGEELYPVVGTNGKLGASFDGLTMLEADSFEHKLLNNELRECMVDGCTGADLPLYHQVQMEQQCMVSEETQRVLFMASEWTPEGELIEERHCWYYPNLELRERIERGWVQFHEDVATWKPEAEEVKPVATVIEALPALVVHVEGRVLRSNLNVYRAAADKFIASINTTLATDQDFADAETAIKFCEGGEAKLKAVKEAALGQTASIDELFKTVDHIAEQMRQKRLALEKLVKSRKDQIRIEHVANAQAELDAHVQNLNARLGANWLPRSVGAFAEAIKGKRTVDSVKEAIAVTLANAKIAANAMADRLELNRRTLRHEDDSDWVFLFADFATVGAKPAEDFAAIAAQRIKAHQDRQAEEKRQRELEEQRRAERAAEGGRQAKARLQELAVAAPAPTPQPAPYRVEQTIAVAGQAAAVIDAPERQADKALPQLKLGDINERFGFTLTREFIEQTLKIEPAETRQRAVLFHGSDWPRICRALVEHIQRSV